MKLQIHNKHPVDWFSDIAHSLDSFWDSSQSGSRSFLPSCDFQETDDYYFFSFDIPGVKKEDIHIEFHDGSLHISGEKKSDFSSKKTEGRKFSEKFYGKFQRSFSLPAPVKENEIEAQFKDGVLELLVPKTQRKKGLKIPIGEDKKDGLISRLLKK